MDNLTIITNNQPRLITDAYELSASERAQFDYYDWSMIEQGQADCPQFVRYKGELIDLGDLEGGWGMGRTGGFPPSGWTAYRSDSFFSGVLIRFLDDDVDRVVMGRYYA